MKTVVTTLNAKYIHSSLAVRLLYVANKHRVNISFKEYTIKEEIATVAKSLLAELPDIIGIGVYIWNVEKTRQLIEELRRLKPELVIILGGPEVSYEPEYFISSWEVDYIVSGEGEFVLGDLLEAIEQGKPSLIDGVSTKYHISRQAVQADLSRLASLPSPYMLPEDRDSLQHKVVYVETSRGCPYQCQYCLSSLEKGVRYFPEEYIRNNLSYLIDGGAKQIKFLDRTFNLNKTHTTAIFDFLIERYREGLSCQFEIYADLLSTEMVDYLNAKLPSQYFRFEVGIQSTHEPTNLAVKRKQDFSLLSTRLKQLMEGGKVDLHLDLIAGLPYETFDLFVQSFNNVFTLRAKEVQLGFLKMLRGTSLRTNASKHGYTFDEHAPYQIEQNSYISATELQRIHQAEHMLEKYWNSGRFTRSMQALFDNEYKDKYFQFFDQLGEYHKTHQLKQYGYQLEDLFRNLYHFLATQNIDITNELRTDYYHCFTQRPNGSWLPPISKQVKKKIVQQLQADTKFLSKHQLTPYIIEKQTAFDIDSEGKILLTIFKAETKGNNLLTLHYVS